MVPTRTWLAAFLLLLPALAARAQSKATLPWNAWLGGQLNYLTAGDHAYLLRARVERSFDADYNAYGPGDNLQRAVVQLGYERLLSARWTGGLVGKLTLDPGPTRTFYTGAFLRHCGHIGSVQFRKRAVLEHVARDHDQPNTAQLRLRADLDRVFHAGQTWLRPRLGYEAQFDYNLQASGKDEAKTDTRFVDYGTMRLELAVARGPRLTLVPFVQKRTDFFIAVGQSADPNVAPVSGPRNLRRPAVGLEVRYTLLAATPTDDARRDLPTFEGYQD